MDESEVELVRQVRENRYDPAKVDEILFGPGGSEAARARAVQFGLLVSALRDNLLLLRVKYEEELYNAKVVYDRNRF